MGFHIPWSGSGSVYRETETIVSPNILYRMQGSAQQLNMGLYVQKGPYVGGVWYRNQDAFKKLNKIFKNSSLDVFIDNTGIPSIIENGYQLTKKDVQNYYIFKIY